MKKIALTLALLTSLVHHTFAQKEVNLLTLNKPINGFNHQGSMSVYSRQSSSMPPRIMMVPAEDGVVVKAEDALYKLGPYNKNNGRLNCLSSLNEMVSHQFLL